MSWTTPFIQAEELEMGLSLVELRGLSMVEKRFLVSLNEMGGTLARLYRVGRG